MPAPVQAIHRAKFSHESRWCSVRSLCTLASTAAGGAAAPWRKHAAISLVSTSIASV